MSKQILVIFAGLLVACNGANSVQEIYSPLYDYDFVDTLNGKTLSINFKDCEDDGSGSSGLCEVIAEYGDSECALWGSVATYTCDDDSSHCETETNEYYFEFERNTLGITAECAEMFDYDNGISERTWKLKMSSATQMKITIFE